MCCSPCRYKYQYIIFKIHIENYCIREYSIKIREYFKKYGNILAFYREYGIGIFHEK